MRSCLRAVTVVLSLASAVPATAQDRADGDPFAFAVMGSTVEQAARGARATLKAIPVDTVRFVVHFDLSAPSSRSCDDGAIDARRRLLDASVLPIVPVVAAAGWSVCGAGDAADAPDRLAHLGDALFAGEESAGQARLRWARQSALPRFGRSRENVRWQSGRVLFVTFNLPDNNNNVRHGAGRNGEFEDRSLANHAWLERAFRFASERRLAGIVLFVDATPRFELPLRPPDPSSHERDGFYEWKITLRTLVASFRGQVLLVQGHGARAAEVLDDHPLRDVAGRPIAAFTRVALASPASSERWMRVEVDPRSPRVFRVVRERVFDDPSGELYGAGRTP